MKTRHPFKLEIALALHNGKELTSEAIMQALEPVLGKGRLLTRPDVEYALQSLQNVGIITSKTPYPSGEPLYLLTASGAERVRQSL